MKRNAFLLLAVLSAFGFPGSLRADILEDSVNATQSADSGAYWAVDDVGWLYTPSSNYDLSGIDTMFSIPTGTSIEDRTVTVAVYQNNTPANGGTLLGSFQFNSSLADGILGGGSFTTPVALTGGQTYFIGFENVAPMSSTNNVDDLGVNFTANPSATFLSDTYYDVSGAGSSCPGADTFSCEDSNTDILGEPILEFFTPAAVSPTPEPASFLLLGAGMVALGLFRRRILARH